MTLTEFLLARIADKIQVTDSCWIWTGGLNRNGYGQVMHPDTKRNVVAHRLVYETLVGPIPVGLQLDHLCRVRACVNPAHLEPVTQRINLLRGETITARAASAMSCPAGHPYSGTNLYRDPDGNRRCRECHRLRQDARRTANPEAARAAARRHDQAYRDRKRAAVYADHPDFDEAWRQ